MTQEEKVDDNKLGLWQSLLRDASNTNRDSSLRRSTLLLCGDAEVGKRSLLKAMIEPDDDHSEWRIGTNFMNMRMKRYIMLRRGGYQREAMQDF